MNKRQQTKELLNEWRKVLNEGLYDQDPEILEEGLKDIGRNLGIAAAALLATSLISTGDAAGRPPEAAMIKIMKGAQKNVDVSKLTSDEALKIMLSSMVEYAERKGNLNEIPEHVLEAMAKIVDKDIKELSSEEIKIATIFLKGGVETGNALAEKAIKVYDDFNAKYPEGLDSVNYDNIDLNSMNDDEENKYNQFIADIKAVKAAHGVAEEFQQCFERISGSFKAIKGVAFKNKIQHIGKKVDLAIEGLGKYSYQLDGSKPAP